MNERQKKLAAKVGRLTQRLETEIKDPALSPAENARAEAELKAIASRLVDAIPDPRYSAEQRVERLAHAVSGASPNMNMLEPASHVLARLKTRIDELVPEADLTTEAKIDKLAALFRAAFSDKMSA